MNYFTNLPGKVKQYSAVGLVVILSFFSVPKMLPLLNPITMLVRDDDLESMNWINTHIPSEEPILIQPFLWGYGLYSGSDGGTWIPALAQRASLPPPVLFAMTSTPSQIKRINTIAQRTIEYSAKPGELANWMNLNGINYIYLGGRGGNISPWVLFQSNYFHLIYHHQSVFIFQVLALENHP